MSNLLQDVLDPDIVQEKLNFIYGRWRDELKQNDAWFEGAVPPHLIKVTAAYCNAPVRILFYGQETEGWGSEAAQSFDCFVGGDCTISQLLNEYEKFDFANGSRRRSSPLWRAFHYMQDLDGCSALWANLCRVGFETTSGYSFLRAPAERRTKFVAQQTTLMREEIDVLRPHAVIFATGPLYDHILTEVFDVERFDDVVPGLTSKQLGRIVSRFLPALSFRTYHPGFLNRDHQLRWRWLQEARSQIAQGCPTAAAQDAAGR